MGVEVGEQLFEELGWGLFGLGEPEEKMVKMSTVKPERCAGIWDGGVMEGKVPQGQFGMLAEMGGSDGGEVPDGGKVVEMAATGVKGKKMVKRVSKFAR